MSLLQDLHEVYKFEGNIPLDEAYEAVNEQVKTSLVEDDITDTGRWYIMHRAVLQRGEEYAAVEYYEPATEMQEWDAAPTPEVYQVEPEEITKIVFTRVWDD